MKTFQWSWTRSINHWFVVVCIVVVKRVKNRDVEKFDIPMEVGGGGGLTGIKKRREISPRSHARLQGKKSSWTKKQTLFSRHSDGLGDAKVTKRSRRLLRSQSHLQPDAGQFSSQNYGVKRLANFSTRFKTLLNVIILRGCSLSSISFRTDYSMPGFYHLKA